MVLALLAGRAQSQAPSTAPTGTEDALQRARMHFEAGRALYKLGNFTEAAREFGSGYELAPRPGFLLNLGQCYIALRDLPKAREMYQRWLHDAPDNDPERRQAEDILAEIERKLAAQPAESVAPPAGVAPASAATVHAAALPRRSWLKRHWWLLPTSLVVVGASVAVGVYFGTRHDPCAGADVIGCFALGGKGAL
jgi:tetratricopeptide (TPR) repeat protein